MPSLLELSQQDRHEEVLGLPFRPVSRDIDNQKIRLLSQYSSDTAAKMAINKAASMLKKELQDKQLYLERIRQVGHVLFKNKQYSAALKYADQALSIEDSENEYMLKSFALLHLGRKNESLEYVERCANLYPNSEAGKIISILRSLPPTHIPNLFESSPPIPRIPRPRMPAADPFSRTIPSSTLGRPSIIWKPNPLISGIKKTLGFGLEVLRRVFI